MFRSSVLTYHSVDDSGSVISVRPEVFSNQMEWLSRSGIPIVPLQQVTAIPGSLAITFDDGFQSFYLHAFPVLQRFKLAATVFVVSGYCGRMNDWSTQPAGIPRMRLMNWSEVREVARHGISLGSHTVTHPRLPALSLQEAEEEIRKGNEEVEDRTGYAVETFAYPYGESTEAVRRYASEHFAISCGTDLGFVRAGADLSNLPRLDMYYFARQFPFKRFDTLLGRTYLAGRSALRAVRSVAVKPARIFS